MKTYEENKKGEEGERILLIEWTSISFITILTSFSHFQSEIKIKIIKKKQLEYIP
jgi:hypothetical protein